MKKSTTPMFCKQFPPFVKNGNVWFDNVMQRSYVWEQTRKSDLIHTLMCGLIVPTIYAVKKTVPVSDVYRKSMNLIGIEKKWAERIESDKFTETDFLYAKLSDEDKEKIKDYNKVYKKYKRAVEAGDVETKTIYDILDGKQRINAIADFISGKYYLIGIRDVTYINADGDEVTIDVNGFYYNDLPDELKENINDFSITFCFIDDATDDQLREIFRKLNNGKPFSTKERNIANCVDISNVSGIGEHELFNVMLTEKAREKRSQIPIVMKTWAILNQDMRDISFSSAEFNTLMMETKITQEQREELVKVFDRFLAMYKYITESKEKKVAKDVCKKMLSETHMISLVPFVKQSIDDGISLELMADFIVENFGGDVIVSDEYQEVSRASSAKNVSIRRRHSALDEAWDRFFKEDDMEQPVSDEPESVENAGTETIEESETTNEPQDVENSDDFMNPPVEEEGVEDNA